MYARTKNRKMKALAKPAIHQAALELTISSNTMTVFGLSRSSLKDRKRTRDTIRKDSTSTMAASEVSLTRRYSPLLWLTMTMKTSRLAAGGIERPSVNLPGFLWPEVSLRRERTLNRAKRRAHAHTKRPAMK